MLNRRSQIEFKNSIRIFQMYLNEQEYIKYIRYIKW